MTSRGFQLEMSSKRRESSIVRRKNQKVQPIVSNQDIDNPFFGSGSSNRQNLPLGNQLPKAQEFLLMPTNRIYHEKGASRPYNNPQGNVKSRIPRASLNNICKVEMEVVERPGRPQSSQGNKQKNNQELFTIHHENPHFQNRPGSSKSSRLFRRKGPFGSDTLNTQNDQSQSLVRVTCTRAGTSSIKSKNGNKERAGTSLNNRKRVIQKIPGKIDPDFFRLFAQ